MYAARRHHRRTWPLWLAGTHGRWTRRPRHDHRLPASCRGLGRASLADYPCRGGLLGCHASCRTLGTVLVLLLVPPLVLSLLLLSKQFYLPAVLEVMALGAVDLAILLVGASWLVGSRQAPASDTPGNLLAGVAHLGILGGAGVVEFLDGKHGLALVLLVMASALLRWGGGVTSGVGFRTGIFAGVLPSLVNASASIG